MYTWEIEKLLRERNNILFNDEYLKIIKESPQIKHIKYDKDNDNFEIWTNETNNVEKHFKYKVKKRKKQNNNS